MKTVTQSYCIKCVKPIKNNFRLQEPLHGEYLRGHGKKNKKKETGVSERVAKLIAVCDLMVRAVSATTDECR